MRAQSVRASGGTKDGLQKQRVRRHVDIAYSTHESGYIQAFGPRLNQVVVDEFERRGITGRKEATLNRVEPRKADAAAEHLAERILGEVPAAAFDPVSMCIMEQFDKATFAQVPLRLTGDPASPVTVREDALELYRVGSGPIWRIAKKMLGAAIPQRFTSGQPFHAGSSWTMMEAGVKLMAGVFSD